MSGLLNELDSYEDVNRAVATGSREKVHNLVCTDGLKLNIKAYNLDHAKRIVKAIYEREVS